ncbi:hypothetical protein TKK_0000096 [Trichogramma kaykai]|uniref:Uncharacterized protein n=1 Tax=Trichogramma kaykai TaxID=54128 RepID=A0ABD2VTJ5_9HYME
MHSNNLIAYGAVMGVIFLIEGISHSVSCTSTSSTGLFYRPDKLYTAPGPGKRALLDSDEDAQQQQRLDRYNVIVRSLMQRLPKYLPIHWFAFKSTTKKSAVYEQQQQQQPAPGGIILLNDVQQIDRSSSSSSNDEEINNNNNNSEGGNDGVGELSTDDMFKAENMVSFF